MARLKLEDLFEIREDSEIVTVILKPKKRKTSRIDIVTELGIISIYPARSYNKLPTQSIFIKSTVYSEEASRFLMELKSFNRRDGAYIVLGWDAFYFEKTLKG